MTIIIILILVVIILLLVLILYKITKTSLILSTKEKEYLTFASDIFIEYGSELGIQSKDQHEKLSVELNKIKAKLTKNVQ